MSDGDSRGRGKAGLVAAGVAALLLGGAIFTDALYNQSIGQIEAENRAAEYAETARIEVSPLCVARELAPAACSEEIEDRARPEQRFEYDLEAQRTMAAWTRAMGFAAIIGMAVGIFGLGLIYRTWDATREAAESSRNTFQAYLSKERGHLQLDGAFTTWSGNALDPRSGVTIQLKNVGLSSCTITHVAYCEHKDPRWRPNNLVEVSVSKLVPAEAVGRTPQLDLRDLKQGSVQGFIDYTTLGSIEGRVYFSLTLSYRPDNGLDPEDWRADIYRPLGMPRDT